MENLTSSLLEQTALAQKFRWISFEIQPNYRQITYAAARNQPAQTTIFFCASDLLTNFPGSAPV